MLKLHDFLHMRSYSAFVYIYNKTVSWFCNQLSWNRLSNN